jgi:Spy/CpxP family protein refolding chaperone
MCTPALSFADTTSDVTPGVTPASPTATHHHHRGWAAMAQQLDLSQQQQQQIKTLSANYKQAHPKGSQPDLAARKQLHEQILAVLTPDQRTKLQQLKQQWHTKRVQQNPSPSPSPQ